MKSQWIPILLNLLAAVLGAVGQYLYKIGAARLTEVAIWKNWAIFSGMFLFILVMILFVASFRLGGRLSVVYPVYATTFLWGTAIAIFVAGEPYNVMQLLGVGTIFAGVCLVAFSAT